MSMPMKRFARAVGECPSALVRFSAHPPAHSTSAAAHSSLLCSS